MIDHLQDAADAQECDLDLTVEQMFHGYRVKPGAPQLAVAQRALRACGFEPQAIASGGASDVNSFVLHGFDSICLADGVQRNHEPTERVSVEALEAMFDVALTLVDEAAVQLSQEPVTRMSGFEPVGSEVKWQGAIITAGVASYRYPDGRVVTRDKVWHPGAVGILAVDAEQVWLTRQPREVTGMTDSLEIPAGKLDVPGEPPLACAQRELAEEIGMRAVAGPSSTASTRAPASATSTSGCTSPGSLRRSTEAPSPRTTSRSRPCRGRLTGLARRSPSATTPSR